MPHSRHPSAPPASRIDPLAIDPDLDYACVPAATISSDEADLAEARRRTHDALVTLLGARRVGGVVWQQHRHEQACKVVSEVLLATDLDAANRHVWQSLADWLGQHPESMLVMAFAPGRNIRPPS